MSVTTKSSYALLKKGNGLNNPFNLPSKSAPDRALKVAKQEADNAIQKAITSQMTTDQVHRITEYARSMKYGVSGVAPIVCKGPNCPYYQKCPLVVASVELPIGKDCPVETGLQQMWLEQFLKASGIELDDMQQYTYDMLLLNDLSFYQLLETRATMELAMDPAILQKTFAGYDKDGNAVSTQVMNPIINFKEKISKMKMKVMHELIATRRAKSEDARAQTNDKASQIAEMLKRVKEINVVNVDSHREV
jgi:hypothetical protein